MFDLRDSQTLTEDLMDKVCDCLSFQVIGIKFVIQKSKFEIKMFEKFINKIITECKHLQELKLMFDFSSVGKEHCEHIANLFKKRTKLKIIKLVFPSCKEIFDDEITLLMESILFCQDLNHLAIDISNTGTTLECHDSI